MNGLKTKSRVFIGQCLRCWLVSFICVTSVYSAEFEQLPENSKAIMVEDKEMSNCLPFKAKNGSAIVIGKLDSDLISDVLGSRTQVDGAEILKKLLRNRYSDLDLSNIDIRQLHITAAPYFEYIDVLVANLFEVEITAYEVLLVQLAIGHHIPVVLTKTNGIKMAKLLGSAGADAELVTLMKVNNVPTIKVWLDKGVEFEKESIEYDSLKESLASALFRDN